MITPYLSTELDPLFQSKQSPLGPDVFYLGSLAGNWTTQLTKFNFTRLIDAVQSAGQSDDESYRLRAKQFENLGAYNRYNTSYYQQFGDDLPSIATAVAKLSGLAEATVSAIRQPPGNIIPWHQDQYYQLKKRLGTERIQDASIWRYLVFLEDHKPGHFFQVENTPYVQWKAGDVVTFLPNAHHLSANAGLEDKFTMQITGLDSPNSWLHRPSQSSQQIDEINL